MLGAPGLLRLGMTRGRKSMETRGPAEISGLRQPLSQWGGEYGEMKRRDFEETENHDEHLIASFGGARVVRETCGCPKVIGGNDDDRAAASSWMGLFLPRSSVADSSRVACLPQTNPFEWPDLVRRLRDREQDPRD